MMSLYLIKLALDDVTITKECSKKKLTHLLCGFYLI